MSGAGEAASAPGSATPGPRARAPTPAAAGPAPPPAAPRAAAGGAALSACARTRPAPPPLLRARPVSGRGARVRGPAPRRGPGQRRAAEPPPHLPEPGLPAYARSRSLRAARFFPRGRGLGAPCGPARPPPPGCALRALAGSAALSVHSSPRPGTPTAAAGLRGPGVRVKPGLPTLAGRSCTPSPRRCHTRGPPVSFDLRAGRTRGPLLSAPARPSPGVGHIPPAVPETP